MMKLLLLQIALLALFSCSSHNTTGTIAPSIDNNDSVVTLNWKPHAIYIAFYEKYPTDSNSIGSRFDTMRILYRLKNGDSIEPNDYSFYQYKDNGCPVFSSRSVLAKGPRPLMVINNQANDTSRYNNLASLEFKLTFSGNYDVYLVYDNELLTPDSFYTNCTLFNTNAYVNIKRFSTDSHFTCPDHGQCLSQTTLDTLFLNSRRTYNYKINVK